MLMEAELQELRGKEQWFDRELHQLKGSMNEAVFERDRAMRRLVDEECERIAAQAEVAELQQLLKRSRDAIGAIEVSQDLSRLSASAPAFPGGWLRNVLQEDTGSDMQRGTRGRRQFVSYHDLTC
ncbi:unnamed protein product [Chrysoparadoxa australica]